MQAIAGAATLFTEAGLFLDQTGSLLPQRVLLAAKTRGFGPKVLHLHAALGQGRIGVENVERNPPAVAQDLLHAPIVFFRLLAKLTPFTFEAFFFLTQRLAALFVFRDFKLL